MADRMITIGAEDAGAFELLDKLKESSAEIYDAVIQKAEAYSSKLSQQAERAKNIIDREKELRGILADERKEMLQSERDRKLAQLDPKDFAFSEKRKDLVNEYGDAIRDVNHELRDFNATMRDVSRQSSEHFTQSQDAAKTSGGGFMKSFGKGAVQGGVTGFLTGGGLGALASTLVGGSLSALGTTDILGFSAPDLSILGGGITGALFGQGQSAAEARHRLLATTGSASPPNLTHLGIDMSSTMQRQTMLSQLSGSRETAKSVGAISAMELGLGMGQGGLNSFIGLRGKGVKDKTEDMVTQFLQMAIASDLWNVKAGDFSVMPKRLADLSATLESATRVMVNPDAQHAIFIKTAFASMGELFAGGRGQNLMMGIHEGIQNPSNPFQQAMTLEAIMTANPDIGGGAIGLARAKAIQSRGIHGEGTLEAILEQIRQSTEDPLMRQVALVSRFKHLSPFLESKSLENLISSPSGRFGGMASDEIGKVLREEEGFSQEKINKIFNVTGATATAQLQAKILTELQGLGMKVSEGAAEGILTIIQKLENSTFLEEILGSLGKIEENLAE